MNGFRQDGFGFGSGDRDTDEDNDIDAASTAGEGGVACDAAFTNADATETVPSDDNDDDDGAEEVEEDEGGGGDVDDEENGGFEDEEPEPEPEKEVSEQVSDIAARLLETKGGTAGLGDDEYEEARQRKRSSLFSKNPTRPACYVLNLTRNLTPRIID